MRVMVIVVSDLCSMSFRSFFVWYLFHSEDACGWQSRQKAVDSLWNSTKTLNVFHEEPMTVLGSQHFNLITLVVGRGGRRRWGRGGF